MRILLAITCWLAATGCDSFEPVGTYTGDVTRSSTSMRRTSDLAADGTSTANTTRSNASDTGVRVTVTRADESHLDLALGDFCRVRAQMSPEPNDHNGLIQITPVQSCRLSLEGFEGDVPVTGTVMFSRDEPRTLTVSMNGAANHGDQDRAGSTSVSFSYEFRGEAPES